MPGEGLILLDVVVPSAHPMQLLDVTLPALARAVERSATTVASVAVVDDRDRPEVKALCQTLDFVWLRGAGQGAGPARNLGASHGGADVIVFVDDDVELDATAFEQLDPRSWPRTLVGVLGGLRPPEGTPDWLAWAYEDAVLTNASGLAPERWLHPHELTTGLCALRREALAAAGGFPDARGIEDCLLGFALEKLDEGHRLRLEHHLSGVHHYTPTWSEWLDRCRASGAVLHTVAPGLPEEQRQVLLSARSLGGGWRGTAKRRLGSLPPSVLELARGRTLRRVAAAAQEAAGFSAGPS